MGIARYLLRQLPPHLRQETEFNLQMSFQQSSRIVPLVCESIRCSAASEAAGVGMTDASGLFGNPGPSDVDLALDWRDLYLLLHSLQASKPILHHRTSSSRVATEAAVFTDIEQLAWRIVQRDTRVATSSSKNAGSPTKTLEKHVQDQVELLLNFGGKQIHAREWKALLLMDIAFFWIEQNDSNIGDGKHLPAKSATALLLLQAIFEMEEIVAALKNSITACHDIQAWSFGRLEQVFQDNVSPVGRSTTLLRKSSWEELYRFLSQEVGKFIHSNTSSVTSYGNDNDEDSGEEYDFEDSGLQRFRFDSLDAFYQQNASLDGAASIGFVFEKVLSCLIEFEKAAARSKVSSEGTPIEGLDDKDSDIKEWLIDLVSNWKYFFHWVCQDSEDLLHSSVVQSRAGGKSGWWKFVARVYIGCAVCNITIAMLMQQNPTNSDGPLHAAFCADDSGVSVWSLIEVEFSLHRMARKLAGHYASEMETSLSKDYVKAVSYGLHRVLQSKEAQILTAIYNTLTDTGETNTPASDRPGGVSFDAVLFTLDSCSSSLKDEAVYGSHFPRYSETEGLCKPRSVLEMLLSIYVNIRDRIITARDASSYKNNQSDPPVCRSQFSVYADSISAKLPLAARHLVAPAKNAKTVVLLDSKGGEEMLEHVCAAIGRTLDIMAKSTNLDSVNNEIGAVLHNSSWLEAEQPPCEGICNFARLSRFFLSEVKTCVQLNGFTKLGVSCATISKRLMNIGSGTIDWKAFPSYWHTLPSLAYDILCENVVYNPRFLRLLLSISLPIQFALQVNLFVTMENKIAGVIQACGLNSRENSTASMDTSEGHRKHNAPAKEKGGRKRTRVGRKRLRQALDGRSAYGLRVDSDSDSDASYSSGSDSSVSDDTDAVMDSDSNLRLIDRDSFINRDRIPHLQSQASQSAAIVVVLAVLEQSQSTLLTALTAKSSGNKPFADHQEILGYLRIHELVNQAICENRDFSWGSRKILLKVLHTIELSMRIGKASGAPRKGYDVEGGLLPETLICIFEAAVVLSLKSRTWVDGVKDASQDSGTKTKVLSCLGHFGYLSALPDDFKDRLKALIAVVKEKVAPTTTNHANTGRGKAKASKRLLGVVPIVRKRRKRLRSRHPVIDAFLNEEDGADAFADLEDFIE
ncbi:unnamed protein product [Phytophthora fragariaefolia]|uniref:Unnamed protein product n=1 Tax=Phytophthora fragariaefolia TaxID=1490495 RepID=A0A9W7DBZ2_9STRA|nr:unnamed protein product [Phytophthora fragariaefolia]